MLDYIILSLLNFWEALSNLKNLSLLLMSNSYYYNYSPVKVLVFNCDFSVKNTQMYYFYYYECHHFLHFFRILQYCLWNYLCLFFQLQFLNYFLFTIWLKIHFKNFLYENIIINVRAFYYFIIKFAIIHLKNGFKVSKTLLLSSKCYKHCYCYFDGYS